jgi:hypothetical protein
MLLINASRIAEQEQEAFTTASTGGNTPQHPGPLFVKKKLRI